MLNGYIYTTVVPCRASATILKILQNVPLNSRTNALHFALPSLLTLADSWDILSTSFSVSPLTLGQMYVYRDFPQRWWSNFAGYGK